MPSIMIETITFLSLNIFWILYTHQYWILHNICFGCISIHYLKTYGSDQVFFLSLTYGISRRSTNQVVQNTVLGYKLGWKRRTYFPKLKSIQSPFSNALSIVFIPTIDPDLHTSKNSRISSPEFVPLKKNSHFLDEPPNSRGE